LSALVVFTGVAIALAPWLVTGLAFGFTPDPQKFALTVVLTRICLPYLACMSIIGLLGGILSAHRRYLAPALAPVILNIVMIAALVAIDLSGYMRSTEAGYILAVAVSLSGLCQLLMVAFAIRRGGFGLTLRWPRMTGSIRHLLKNSVPVFIGGGITQINIVIGTAIASLKPGTVSDLYYADRIYQLPLGVIGIAIGVVLLPELLHRIRINREDLALDTQNRSLEMALALTLPAAVGLAVAAHPIVEVLFERGAFGPRDTDMTALALRGFAFGLPAFVAIKVLTAALFARVDLKTPMWAGIAAVVVSLGLSLLLFNRWGGAGIAIAASAAGWVNAAILWVALARRKHWRIDGPLEHRLPRLLLASVAMGFVVWVLREVLDRWLGAENLLQVKVAALAILVGLGAGVFSGVGLLIGGIDLASIRSGLKGSEPHDEDPLIAALPSD
jgi:putative peptidoglycan lipid II flippase